VRPITGLPIPRGTAALLIALVALAAAWGAPSAAAPPRVETMVVGQGAILFEGRTLAVGPATIRASGRPCRVGQATPLSLLAAADQAGGPAFRTRDDGSCSTLFVFQIGREANRGRDGWVYKVDRRLGTTGAADPTGPFGTGRRLRDGQRVVWFWCRRTAAGSCQRTLELAGLPRTAPAGAPLTVRVRGVDDRGRAVDVPGATVTARAGGVPFTARTGPDGRARLTLPAAGAFDVRATADGLVPTLRGRIVVR